LPRAGVPPQEKNRQKKPQLVGVVVEKCPASRPVLHSNEKTLQAQSSRARDVSSLMSIARAAPSLTPPQSVHDTCTIDSTNGAHRRAAHAICCKNSGGSIQVGQQSCDSGNHVAKPAGKTVLASVAESPPDSTHVEMKQHARPIAPVPGVPAHTMDSDSFDPKAFHRELSAILRNLGSDRNVAAAVGKVRAQKVPVAYQAREFADIITRAAEESRGPVRRSAFAFAAGLAAAQESAFDRAQCIIGAGIFFQEVYQGLCEEVPRLSAIMSAELLPTLRTVLPALELRALLPKDLQKP